MKRINWTIRMMMLLLVLGVSSFLATAKVEAATSKKIQKLVVYSIDKNAQVREARKINSAIIKKWKLKIKAIPKQGKPYIVKADKVSIQEKGQIVTKA